MLMFAASAIAVETIPVETVPAREPATIARVATTAVMDTPSRPPRQREAACLFPSPAV